MVNPREILYLARADVEAALPSLAEMEAAVEQAFRGLASGSSENAPKLGIDPAPGTFFHAMPARAAQAVGSKWVGVANNSRRGFPELPHINAMIVMNDLESAVVTAVMDGDAITALRPAAVSMVAARKLARPGSSRIGFIACGVQARAHIDAFAAAYPLREATCYSRNPETAARFADELKQRGLKATATMEAREAVEGQDVVVTSIPRNPGLKAYLDPAWVSPGCFVTAPDLARYWILDSLGSMDVLATDERKQTAEAAAHGVMPWQGKWDADLVELVAGDHPGRASAQQRTFFAHPGLGLGDIAIAALVLEKAKARGLGTKLPR